MKFCSHCGAALGGETARFCGECGTPCGQPAPSRPNSDLNDSELRTKAEAGDVEAVKDVGVRAERAGNIDAAVEWYLNAAGLGHAGAMRNLGNCLSGRQEYREAEMWYLRSIDAGNTQAPMNLGGMYYSIGRTDEACEMWKTALGAGDYDAAHNLGYVAEEQGRFEEAIDWYSTAIEGGRAASAGNLARLQSRLAELQDNATAVRSLLGPPKYIVDFEDWSTRESDESWVTMVPQQLENGEDLSYGWFMQQSEISANEGSSMMEDYWLRKAAQRGSAIAMMLLGESRSELEHDDEALRWFRRAEFLVSDERNDPDLSASDRAEILRDSREFANTTIANGANPNVLAPRDIGVNSLAAEGLAMTYCLRCGMAKYPNAPLGQCDDTVHVVEHRFG